MPIQGEADYVTFIALVQTKYMEHRRHKYRITELHKDVFRCNQLAYSVRLSDRLLFERRNVNSVFEPC